MRQIQRAPYGDLSRKFIFGNADRAAGSALREDAVIFAQTRKMTFMS